MKKIKGYAKFRDGSLRPAVLYRYKNGLNVVEWADRYFEAIQDIPNAVSVVENNCDMTHFLFAE